MKLSDALALGRLDAHDQSALARRGMAEGRGEAFVAVFEK